MLDTLFTHGPRETRIGELLPSTYLTDGRRLFCLIRGFSWPPEQSYAVLEDCRTLVVSRVRPSELWRMQLTVVAAPARLEDEPQE